MKDVCVCVPANSVGTEHHSLFVGYQPTLFHEIPLRQRYSQGVEGVSVFAFIRNGPCVLLRRRAFMLPR